MILMECGGHFSICVVCIHTWYILKLFRHTKHVSGSFLALKVTLQYEKLQSPCYCERRYKYCPSLLLWLLNPSLSLRFSFSRYCDYLNPSLFLSHAKISQSLITSLRSCGETILPAMRRMDYRSDAWSWELFHCEYTRQADRDWSKPLRR